MVNESPHRVLILSLEFLRDGHAAREHVLAIQSRLIAYGWKASLVAQLAGPTSTTGKFKRIIRYAGLTLRTLRQLGDADVLYIRSHPAAIFLSAIAHLRGLAVVHEVNGRMTDIAVTHGLSRWASWMTQALQHWQYRRAAALIAVTPGLAEWAGEVAGPDVPVHLITNGADTELFHPLDTSPSLEKPYVLFFGGLTAWHGVKTMIQAITSDAWPADVQMIIAGEGSLSRMVRESALTTPGLTAPGFIERRKLAVLAKRAIAILVPIEHQGGRDVTGVAPLKLFEAMASGRPVIATDLPYQRDVVAEGPCGLLIPPSDPAALVEAVSWIVAHPEEADEMGRKGRITAVEQFDWSLKARETAEVLEMVIGQRR